MTIQFKFTMWTVAVVLVANALLAMVTVESIGRRWLDEVQTRVRLDLNSARAAYQSRLERLSWYLRALTFSRTITLGLQEGNVAAIESHLEKAYRTGKMDILTLLDAQGRVVCRAHHPQYRQDLLTHNPLIAQVLREKRGVQGTVVLTAQELQRESAQLAKQAYLEVLPTPAAYPTKDAFRADGLLLAAAEPMFDAQGNLLAILFAAELLNNDFTLVDQIKQEVFADQQYEGRDIGTVTIFLGDLRISTNVVREDGRRAVGTRLSAAVADQVLKEGHTWIGEAFVVNDWYITAYEPIRDPTGRVIGVLYVGLLRAPFLRERHRITWTFVGFIAAASLASLVLIQTGSMLVLKPIRQILAMARRVMEGDLKARVGIRPPGEMGVLCRAIDQMADAILEREEQLKAAMSRQITRSEQLASVGRLAAGVAHEINNPLTGILTFAHMLREKPNMDEQDRQDLDLIIRETTRAAEIVRGLLDFARERPAVKQPLQINDVLRRTLRLLSNQRAFSNIMIVEDLQEGLPLIDGDPNQLQQVFLNLALNACEAMPQGGTLLVTTTLDQDKVLVKVTDTGCGIPPEHLDRIFEPFFTTKPVGKGTGLGLSVSYGIIQQHGGNIEVESKVGFGSTFTVSLPVRRSPSPSPSAVPTTDLK
ncbi:MAG: cache domain-containing protein [Thermoguttaceae bacterium]|nr:cache domain-containing protein [Thermoguttaceae bacterium]MDW8037249.1 cache domain-containing protein [Thermoguttaceae bacterium]